MAIETAIGGDGSLFIGEDKILRLEVLDVAGNPVDTGAWTVRFYLRKKDKAPDPAIFDKDAPVIGTYDSVRTTNTQRREVTLTDDELNTVTARTYRYAWKRMDPGFETVLAWGDATPQKSSAP